MKSTEMLKFVSVDLMTKKICKNEVKKFLFVMIYVTNRYKAQEMCDKKLF